MSELIWVHEDALRREHPVFNGAGDTPCAFIFDDATLAERQYSLKRLQFIAQTLNEMDVPIYRGDTIECLRELAEEFGATRIAVADSPDPEIQRRIHQLRDSIEVIVVKDIPFTPEVDGEFHRFFKFWNKVKKPLMTGND